MEDRLFAARGAVQVDRDEKEMIITAVRTMYDELVEANKITEQDMVSIQFSVTGDLHTLNPATALRSRDNFFPVPLFCMQEPQVEGTLVRTIRMLVLFYAPADHVTTHAYLGGAARLRPDLAAT